MPPKYIKEPFRVVQILDETHDTKTYRLVCVDESKMPAEHKSGQNMALQLTIKGESCRRTYTMSSPATRPATVDFTIKREPGGKASNWLYENLKVGDTIPLVGPNGKFHLADDERPVALAAGGVGVTPLMSMLRDLCDRGDTRPVHLFYCVRSERDLIFAKELEWLAHQNPHFSRVDIFSEQSDVPEGSRTGFLTMDVVKEYLPNFQDCTFFVCGPPPMLDAVLPALKAAGVPEQYVLSEDFGSRKAADGPSRPGAAGPSRPGPSRPGPSRPGGA